MFGGIEYEALVWSDITPWKAAERDLLRANMHLRGIAEANRAINASWSAVNIAASTSSSTKA